MVLTKIMHPSNLKLLKIGRGGGLVDRVADSGPYDPCSIPLGEKKENKRKEAWIGPY